MAQPGNNINYTTVSSLPPDVIINRAYKANNQLEYEGHAIRGTADDSPYWTIRKFTYTGANLISTERIARNVTWDARTTATYV